MPGHAGAGISLIYSERFASQAMPGGASHVAGPGCFTMVPDISYEVTNLANMFGPESI